MMKDRWSAIFGSLATITMVVIALWFLHRELAGISLASVMAHVRSVPAWTLIAASGLTVCSYTILTGYDAIGLRDLGHRIPYPQVALTSFMAFAVGHNVGVASLSGGSIRYRLYSQAGLTTSEVARLIFFVSYTFAIGVCGLLGVSLLLMPVTQTAVLGIPLSVTRWVGYVLLSVPVAYVLFTLLRREPLRFGNWLVAVPVSRIAIAQVGIAVADIVVAAATLFVLLKPQFDIGFLSFLGVFMLALAAGAISNVPGGIGVFEAVLVAALPGVTVPALLGTIIIYRLIYYVGPLVLALLLLIGNESRQHGRKLIAPARQALGRLSGLAPQVIGALVFVAGVVLLVSGASPSADSRLALLSEAVPLPVLELSHLSGSVIGMLLLILARGLFRRLRGAFQFALIAISAGILFSLVKGLDYEEATILLATGSALWLSRSEFYRRGSLLRLRYSAPWITAIGLGFVFAVWIGLLSYRHVEYSNQLWWEFAFNSEAPRMLRASLVAAVTALSFVVWKLIRAEPPLKTGVAAPADMDAARKVLASARYSSANLALVGDKRFLWSPDQQAFIMYQVSGNSWIAMGDPVGPDAYHEELVWAYRELVDRHDGRTVFYEVSDESLSRYIDLGLTLSKLGEEACVSLQDFSLEGGHRAALRQALNRARRNGAEFQVIQRAQVGAIMGEIRRVSDSWLAEKSSAEKGFSLGSFSETYIANFDCATVTVNGDIVAFANLWTAPASGELSVDLMRYVQSAPKGIMDYLFVELMIWGSAQGYRRFNLGMAPLSGLEERSLAPMWHKIGRQIYTHGEEFYGFEGLRNYKNKFDPVWQPRYLACPAGWRNLSAALLDVSRLISGHISEGRAS